MMKRIEIREEVKDTMTKIPTGLLNFVSDVAYVGGNVIGATVRGIVEVPMSLGVGLYNGVKGQSNTAASPEEVTA